MSHPFRKPFIAAMTCAALLFAQGWIRAAGAAEWPTWPRPIAPAPETTPGKPEPAPSPEAPAPDTAQPGSEAASKAGETAGKKTAGGIKAGTVAKWALIGAGIVGIAIAVGGGGGTTSNH